LTGLGRMTVYRLWSEARELVVKEIDPGDVLEVRREVDVRAQAVGDLAWRYAQAPGLSVKERATMLKVTLDAGRARADALGLAKLQVEVTGTARVEWDVLQEVRVRYGIDESALEAVGAALAAEMSSAQRQATRALSGRGLAQLAGPDVVVVVAEEAPEGEG
jgi:hypothetical protein